MNNSIQSGRVLLRNDRVTPRVEGFRPDGIDVAGGTHVGKPIGQNRQQCFVHCSEPIAVYVLFSYGFDAQRREDSFQLCETLLRFLRRGQLQQGGHRVSGRPQHAPLPVEQSADLR